MVEAIFAAAMDAPPDVRSAVIQSRCAGDDALQRDVEELLAHAEQVERTTPHGAPMPLRATIEAALSDTLEEAEPQRVGTYRILRRLGEGGFGVVFLAEQENPRRPVAIKLLRSDSLFGEAARRFEYEARILARLRHPGIAQIYEAGIAGAVRVNADGHRFESPQSFIAMEYVEGPNLIQFVLGDGGRWRPIPIHDRLRLMLEVCRALHHAHQHGVIHRDLKPANILVACHDPVGLGRGDDRGAAVPRLAGVQPKLLDFGVARVVDGETAAFSVASHLRGDMPPRVERGIVSEGGAPPLHSPSPRSRERGDAAGQLDDPTRGRLGSWSRPTAASVSKGALRTAEGRVIGTLAYMSPEQVSGRSDLVDTRSDVYAMGVILHQMLAGVMPYEVEGAPLPDAIRIICEHDPSPIGTLDRSIRTDVHAIVRRAMAKEREHRYSSVAELAADLERLLLGEPIAARQGSGWYLLRRSVRRHRTALAATLALLSLLTASSIAGWVLYAKAEQARAEATSLLRESMLGEARAIRAAGAIGRRIGALDLLKRAAALGDGPDVRSELVAASSLSDFVRLAVLPWTGPATTDGLSSLGRIALLDDASNIRIMDLKRSEELAVLRGLTGAWWAARFSHSGCWFSAIDLHAPSGPRLLVWDVGNPEPCLVRDVADGWSDAVVVERPSGAEVAYAPRGGGVAVAHVLDGSVRLTIEPGWRPGWLAIDDAGERLAILEHGAGAVSLVELESGAALAAAEARTTLRSPCFSEDGELLLAGGADGRVHRWRADGLEPIDPLTGHRAAVVKVFKAEGRIVTGSWDGTVRVWDAATGAPDFAPERGARVLGFDGGRLLLSDGELLTLFALRDESPGTLLAARGEIGPIGTCAFTADDGHLVVAGRQGVELWELPSQRRTILCEEPARCAVTWPDGERVGALVGGSLRSWRLKEGSGAPVPESQRTMQLHELTWLSLAEGGRAIVIAAPGAPSIDLIDLETLATRPLTARVAGAERPELDPTGRWLFHGTWLGAPGRLIDLHGEAPPLEFDHASVRGRFGTAGRLLSVGTPGRQRVYERGSANPLLDLVAGRSALPDLAGASCLSPDGTILAFVEPPDVIRLVRVRDGELLLTLPNPERFGVPDLLFSPLGRWLAILTLEDRVMLWDLSALRKLLEESGSGL